MLKYLFYHIFVPLFLVGKRGCTLLQPKWQLVLVLFLTSNRLLFSQEILFSPPVRLPFTVESEKVTNAILSTESNFLYLTSTGDSTRGSSLNRRAKVDGGDWSPPEKITIANNKAWSVVGMSANGSTFYLINQGKKFKRFVYSISAEALHQKNPKKNSLNRFYKVASLGRKLHSLHVHRSGKLIILSLDLKNGNGSHDLYIVTRDSLKQWTDPLNLGKTINTSGSEITPFLSSDGSRLFFSSDGRTGRGDMDIFYADRLYQTWNVWSLPKNLSGSINSAAFDAHFTMSNQQEASFISDRLEGNPHVYFTEMILPSPYTPVVPKNFSPLSAKMEPLSEEETNNLLGTSETPVILFEEGSAELLPSYREIVYYIANKIRDQKFIHVSLIGHTDQKGDSETNLYLSEDRANAVQEYFMSYGVAAERITSIGLGEQQPLYQGNVNEEHRLNRRVEIILLNSSIPLSKE